MKNPALQAFVLGLLAVSVIGCGSQTEEEGYASLDEALAAAAQEGKPLLVDFYTEW